NTIPTGPYRGAGRPESVLNIERLVDKAARELGMDRLEIRRKNFIRPEQFPYRTGVKYEYDSGEYEKSLAEALRLSDYENLIRYRDEARQCGELVGVGLSTFAEPSGGVGFESATVRVERSGDITVLTGSSSHGQGHETAFAQVVAEKMGVAMNHVVIRHGDTLVVPHGVGTFGSAAPSRVAGPWQSQLIGSLKRLAVSPRTCWRRQPRISFRQMVASPLPECPTKKFPGARLPPQRMAETFPAAWSLAFKRPSSLIRKVKPRASAPIWRWCESIGKPGCRLLKSSSWSMTAALSSTP